MIAQVPNLNEIKLKFIEFLEESGWSSQFKTFIHSDDFTQIINKLYVLKEDGKRFTPPLKNVFKAFEHCKYNETRVVILGQDPYNQFGVANGVAFCCENIPKPQVSLKFILKSIYKTVYPELEIPQTLNPSLRYLSEQGVLLLNTALTCEIGKSASHYEIWESFINYAIDTLNHKKDKLVFILLGKRAQEYEDMIDEDKHFIIKASHPASAAYGNNDQWDCNDCFNKCNEYLKTNNFKPINWLTQ